MIIMPRTGLFSARSASRTTAWYQSGKVERLPVIRLTLSARCIKELLERLHSGAEPGAPPSGRGWLGFVLEAYAVSHAEVLRLHAIVAAHEALGRKAAAQEFAHR